MSDSPRALVLVHGFLGAANNWLAVVAKLKTRPELAGWQIVCPDLRWHAGDEHRFDALGVDENPPSTAAVAKALAKDLQNVAAKEIVVVGHSFGLRPLVKILAQNLVPEKSFLALVAEDSSPELSAHGTRLLEKILRDTPVPFASREEARQHFDDVFGASSAMSRFLQSNIREDAARGGQTWRFPNEVLLDLLRHATQESLAAEWVALDLPVFMVVGEKSEHLSPAQAQKWKSMRDAAGKFTELKVIPEAGHWVHAEKTEDFVLALIDVVVKLPKLVTS